MTFVSVLDPNAYLTTKSVVTENGDSLVHLAEIHSTRTGKKEVFVKVFADKKSPNALLHEIYGFVVAKHLGLPVPEEAFLLLIDSRLLFEIHPNFNHVINNEQGVNIAWCTTTIEGKPIRYLHPINDETLKNRLKKNKSLPEILAFDEFLGNEDRNKGNLIMINNGNFALIDHAEIAGTSNNLGFDIDANSFYKNALISELYDGCPPDKIKSAMVLAAEKHQDAVTNAKDELKNLSDIIHKAYGIMPTNNINDYINTRAKNSPERIKERYGLLI